MLEDDDDDEYASLFGGSDTEETPPQTRTFQLALPAKGKSSRSELSRVAHASDKNVGTIALSASPDQYSEHIIPSCAPSTSTHSISTVARLRPPLKRKQPDDSQPPLTTYHPSTSGFAPQSFLKSRFGTHQRPSSGMEHRGLSAALPIEVDDGPQQRSPSNFASPSTLYQNTLNLRLTDAIQPHQGVLEALVRNHDIHFSIHSLLNTLSQPSPPPPPSNKRKKFRKVPNGAEFWDVPFPFADGEGPEAYRDNWRYTKEKQYLAEMVGAIKLEFDKGKARKEGTEGVRFRMDDVRSVGEKEAFVILELGTETLSQLANDWRDPIKSMAIRGGRFADDPSKVIPLWTSRVRISRPARNSKESFFTVNELLEFILPKSVIPVRLSETSPTPSLSGSFFRSNTRFRSSSTPSWTDSGSVSTPSTSYSALSSGSDAMSCGSAINTPLYNSPPATLPDSFIDPVLFDLATTPTFSSLFASSTPDYYPSPSLADTTPAPTSQQVSTSSTPRAQSSQPPPSKQTSRSSTKNPAQPHRTASPPRRLNIPTHVARQRRKGKEKEVDAFATPEPKLKPSEIRAKAIEKRVKLQTQFEEVQRRLWACSIEEGVLVNLLKGLGSADAPPS